MQYILGLFWLAKTIKAVLFWVYLWQLKEYHIGRFLAHFETEKGKRILLNFLQIFKILLLGGVFLYPKIFPFVLIFIYAAESAMLGKNILQRKRIGPIFTKKAIVLVSLGIFSAILISVFLWLKMGSRENFSKFSLWLLVADILTPILVSAIVLLLQPIAVFGRNQIIKKAKEKRKQYENLLTIGITGSYGKTSTKEFLAVILSEKFNVLKTEKHQNSEIGISQCVLNNLNEEHEIFIAEMGAYNRGGIKLLCDIAKPKIGILTGINEQHMATFGSQEKTIRTKYELIESLPEKGLAIFNGDNQYCLDLYKETRSPKRLCGKTKTINGEKSDVFVENIKIEKDSLSFKTVSKNGDSAELKVNIAGKQNIENLLLAICCAKDLGMTLEEIARACKKIKSEQGAMKIIKGRNNLNIIDSTYSANPDGVISDLDYLKILPGKKVIIMPCLIELGNASKEVHQKIGRKIGEVCDLAIITTRDKYKEIRESALSAGMTEIDIFCFDDPKEIYEKIKAFCKSGDTILLESRVPKQLIRKLTENN